jgi:hypothetical protein
LAEGVGFEPTVPGEEDNGFQDRRLKPLGHPSGSPAPRDHSWLVALDSSPNAGFILTSLFVRVKNFCSKVVSNAGSWPPRGVVSGEFADQRRPFATGNGLTSLTAPMILNLFPAGANLASTGEVILWGYVCNPMMSSRRGRVTQAMVATLKRPPPETAKIMMRNQSITGAPA